MSRRIRLRRTVVAAVVLGVLAVSTVRLVSRQDAVDTAGAAADHVPGVRAAATSTAPTATGSGTPQDDGEDGSATSDSPAFDVAEIPQHGTGEIRVVNVPGPQSTAAGRVVRYTVEMEQGLGVDETEVASTVRAVLLDKRGWQTKDDIRFVNVSPDQESRGSQVDIRITVASPDLTDRLCAPLRTLSQVSCWNGGRSVLNLRRWQLGDDSYGKDVERYRIYQVNHEVGHGLGHQHQSCPAKGQRAPVMVQQTLGLQGCQAWPFPTGA